MHRKIEDSIYPLLTHYYSIQKDRKKIIRYAGQLFCLKFSCYLVLYTFYSSDTNAFLTVQDATDQLFLVVYTHFALFFV